jgi:phosphoglucosamine mutase
MGLFGTDGVRGIANSELTCGIAFALGQAAARELGHQLVIGRDTRRSGMMLEAALTAGITSVGGNALLAGVVPTPAVAYLVRSLNANGGIVISASHNSPEYNGIKFFDAKGFKLSAQIEKAIEEYVQSCGLIPAQEQNQKNVGFSVAAGTKVAVQKKSKPPVTGSKIGTSERIRNPGSRYEIYAANCIRQQLLDFDGIKVALDCAHGAACQTSPDTLRRLGADVAAINTTYTGDDINLRCGSTHLGPLTKLVLKVGADIGIAHDGDADRVLAVSSSGAVIDGDVILAILARDLKQQGKLTGNTVVSTVMANLGFARAMAELEIDVIKTDVGDSNVLREMKSRGLVLGGEQSGHIILSEYNSTGDGLLTALMLIAAMKRSGKSLDELAKVMTSYPQVLINVANVRKSELAKAAAIWDAVRESEEFLESCGGGRVLLRASGTEPLVRVMVEAATSELAQETAEKLAATVTDELAI